MNLNTLTLHLEDEYYLESAVDLYRLHTFGQVKHFLESCQHIRSIIGDVAQNLVLRYFPFLQRLLYHLPNVLGGVPVGNLFDTQQGAFKSVSFLAVKLADGKGRA